MPNFADVLKAIGLVIVHTAEAAATDPTVQAAALKLLETAIATEAKSKG